MDHRIKSGGDEERRGCLTSKIRTPACTRAAVPRSAVAPRVVIAQSWSRMVKTTAFPGRVERFLLRTRYECNDA